MLAKKQVNIIIALDVGVACTFFVSPLTSISDVVIPPPPTPVIPATKPLKPPIPKGSNFEYFPDDFREVSFFMENVLRASQNRNRI